MSLSICEKFSDIRVSGEVREASCDQFYAELKDVAAKIGLKQSYVNRIQEWAEAASQEPYAENKKIAFSELFTPCMKQISGAVIDRSCFLRKPLSEQQIKIDLLHYRCLRAFDTIFDGQDDLYRKWVDQLYDRRILTATEAILILDLMKRTVRSLMRCEYDENRFSSLLESFLGQKEAAVFVEALILLKPDFPIRDAEIVLFAEVVHALFKRPCENRRELFKDFLNGFVNMLRGYNAETKQFYLSYVKEELLQGNKVPEVTPLVKPVPKIKLEADRYWFLRMYDTAVENCRSPFAQEIDELFDQGFLTYSSANELLSLMESPRRWNQFNLREQLTILQEKYRWVFDVSVLLKPFLASVER